MDKPKKKLWGGRFSGGTADSVEAFTASIAIDSRLYRHDIMGSIAHAKMLGKQRIIPLRDAQKIVRGLAAIEREIDSGRFEFSPADEDIHMNIERRLTEKIGGAGGKLHTARSRNDQVALDMRLYLRDEVAAIWHCSTLCNGSLRKAAKKHLDVIMPGYTHLQRAQPVLLRIICWPTTTCSSATASAMPTAGADQRSAVGLRRPCRHDFSDRSSLRRQALRFSADIERIASMR